MQSARQPQDFIGGNCLNCIYVAMPLHVYCKSGNFCVMKLDFVETTPYHVNVNGVCV